MLKRVVVIAVVCGALAGCITQSGSENGGSKSWFAWGRFHGRWWNYYERGAASVADGRYAQAEPDLREALAGRSVDTWRARTYGLHFVTYFPNRELGVASYYLNHLDDAERYLKTSLKQIDTDRAHYYLDLVKKARIAKGELHDDTPPALGSSIQNGAVVSFRQIPLKIRATDSLGVETVTLNGETLSQRGSAPVVQFQRTLMLNEGTHTINIAADNLAGKASTESLTISVDTTGPQIGILAPPSALVTDASSVKLRGITTDANGVASVKLADKVIADPNGAKEAHFESDLPLKDGTNRFVVVATDTAGNDTRAVVSVYKGTRDKTAAFLMSLPDRLLEPLRFAHVRFSALPVMIPGLGDRVRPAVATTANAKNPITIDLRFPKDPTNTDNNEILVTGTVKTVGKLATVAFNGKESPAIPAPVVEFSKRIPLPKIGENPITMRATDDQGNTAEADARVNRTQLAIDDPKEKMGLAVMDFGPAKEPQAPVIRGELEAQLVGLPTDLNPRFNVVDRQHIDKILQEQQLSAAKLADPNSAIELGKILQADVFLYGAVTDWGKGGIEVSVNAVSTTTSDIMKHFDTSISNENDKKTMEAGAKALAMDVFNAFPRVTGDLVQVVGKDLYFDFGTANGVRPGMRVLVVHRGDPVINQMTGEKLMDGKLSVLGEGYIDKVDKKVTRAQTLPREDHAKLEAGMLAVTK